MPGNGKWEPFIDKENILFLGKVPEVFPKEFCALKTNMGSKNFPSR